MRLITLFATMLLCAGLAAAQDAPPTPAPGPGGPPPGAGQGQPRMRRVPDMRTVPDGEMKMRRGGPEGEMRMKAPFPGGGKWWKNSEMVKAVGLSDDQVQRMEKIFQDYRLKLIDQHAALQKEEVSMEPLIESDNPDEAKITAQIDRIAAARAALEKSNALMMLGIRKVMTAEQWKKLQEATPPPPGLMAPPAPGEGMRMKRRGPGGELDE